MSVSKGHDRDENTAAFAVTPAGPLLESTMHKNVPNIPERQFRRLIDGAPTLLCPNCSVAMTIRTLVPVVETNEYRATYRCPQCGRDSLTSI